MPYIEETIVAGRVIEINKYYSTRYKKKSMRGKNINKTKLSQEEVNDRQAEKKLRGEINANFGFGDAHIVCGYKEHLRPKSIEEMKLHLKYFLKELRKIYRRVKKELKYISVLEVGKKGALHIHMVINIPEGVSTREIYGAWIYGRVHVHPLDDSGNYTKLANYLVKQSKNYIRLQEIEGRLQKRRWNCSRNLVKPKVDKRIIKKKDRFNKVESIPRKYKGKCYIDKEYTREGIHEKTGYEFFSYMLVIDERRERWYHMNHMSKKEYSPGQDTKCRNTRS